MRGLYKWLVTNERHAALQCHLVRLLQGLQSSAEMLQSMNCHCTVYSVQYSAVYSVQCSMVWQQRDSHLGSLSAAWLQRMRRSLLSELPSLAPVATDNNINQSPSHLSQRKYILLWRYAGAVFSKILFITHILSKYSCKKSPWKMRPSSIV